VQVSSRLMTVAVVGLLVAAGAAFAIGRATASDGETSGSTGVPGIDAPTAVADTPALRDVGGLPALKEPPASSSRGATASPDSTPSEVTPSEPTPIEPTPPDPTPPDPTPPDPTPPEPPPPPPPGEG
jgi:type VI secretion system secreted protein VgrG